jgi:spore maturation protein SpmA
MLNAIFFILMLLSILLAAFTGRMEAVTQAAIQSAKDAVELALGLVGVMTFFLGLMKVAEEGGLLRILARWLTPLLSRIFPSIPRGHPAIGAIILNISATLLGLGNAATPFGIKAMMELDRLNRTKGTATNAMVLFLAINTSGLTLLPTTMMALRASAHSANVAGILFPTWVAGICASLMAIFLAPLLARLPAYKQTDSLPLLPDNNLGAVPGPPEPIIDPETCSDKAARALVPPRRWHSFTALAIVLALTLALILQIRAASQSTAPIEIFRHVLSFWTLPAIILLILLLGWSRGVKVYEALIEGGKEGFSVALRIIPYLVAILVMVGIFRASGGLEILVNVLGPVAGLMGMPAEALPVALLRPLSGSGTLGVIAEIFKTHGPDSFIGYLVSTIYGSTETTFYVLAVYFGAIGIKNTRHALPACLLADAAGILAGVLMIHLLF